MIRAAKFDGSSTALSSGFQQTQWFSRSDAATDDAGLLVDANIPRYGRQTLILPAPAMSSPTPRPESAQHPFALPTPPSLHGEWNLAQSIVRRYCVEAMSHTTLTLLAASTLCLLGSCSSHTAPWAPVDHFKPASGRVAAPWRPVNQGEIRSKLEQVTREYNARGPLWDGLVHASPRCTPPMIGPVMSSADPGSPHADKLYLLYATPPSAYVSAIGRLPADAGVDTTQPLAVVKEAFVALPATPEEARIYEAQKKHSEYYNKRDKEWRKTHKDMPPPDPNEPPNPQLPKPWDQYATVDGKLYSKGPLYALFIMLKCAEDTPDTDRGWVYATAAPVPRADTAPDQPTAGPVVITSMGKIESCMECYVESKHDRLLGTRVDN
jgi:hypothetical protein